LCRTGCVPPEADRWSDALAAATVFARLTPLLGVDITGGLEYCGAFIQDVAAILIPGPAPDLTTLFRLGLWWLETSTDRRLATKAETASGDGTSALPCDGGVFSLAARTATGGDGVPRVTTLAVFFFFPEEEDGLGGRAAVAVGGEMDFLRRAAASFTASLAPTRLSLSHCWTPSRAACSRDVGVPCATDPTVPDEPLLE
jgi:hypothetical protein